MNEANHENLYYPSMWIFLKLLIPGRLNDRIVLVGVEDDRNTIKMTDQTDRTQPIEILK
jgi:hypothetical protein